jgi:heptosyltransferase-2
VDLHGTARSRLWSLLSGAARCVRYRKRAWARRALVWFKKASPALEGSTVDRYLETLEPLGLPVFLRDPALYFSAGETLSKEWEDRLGPGPFVALAPGALHATKRWPPEYFARAGDQAAQALAGPGGPLPIVLLGAPADVPAAEETLRHLHGPAQSLAGQTTLRELMLILKRCAVLFSNDSGAMHMAAALNIPLVALFGPTVEAFGFFPGGARVRVLERVGLDCRPCSLHGSDRCPQGHFKCMRDTSPQEAAQAAVDLARTTTGAAL